MSNPTAHEEINSRDLASIYTQDILKLFIKLNERNGHKKLQPPVIKSYCIYIIHYILHLYNTLYVVLLYNIYIYGNI